MIATIIEITKTYYYAYFNSVYHKTTTPYPLFG